MGRVGQEISRRSFLKVCATYAAGVAALTTASTVVSCSTTAQPVQLRFGWGETSTPEVDHIKQIVAEYKDKTGVEVIPDVMPSIEVYPKVQASISAGDPYDLFTTGFIADVMVEAQNETIVPVTDLINGPGGGESNYGKRILFPWKGDVWWIPFDYNLAYTNWRSDILKEKGVSVPKTWDDMEQVCKAINNPPDMYAAAWPMSNKDGGNWQGSSVFWANDVTAYDDNFEVILDSPEMMPKVVESLNFYKKMQPYLVPGEENLQPSDTLQLFTNQQVAMIPYCGRLAHNMMEFAPDLLDKFQSAGFPSPSGQGVATHGYDGFVVVKGKHVEESKAFMKWFMEEKWIGFLHTIPIHLFPTRLSTYNDPKWRDNDLIKKYWDQAIVPQYELIYNGKYRSVDTDGPWPDPLPGRVWHENIFPEMMQKVILQNADPQQVVKEAADKIRKLHAEYPPQKA